MNEKVREIIDQVYLKKDYEFFINKCIFNNTLPENLLNYLNNYKEKLLKVKDKNDPSKQFYIKYNEIRKESFYLNLTTIFMISKITEIYSLSHQFEVDNIDLNRVQTTLDGFSDTPYNKSQLEFDQQVSEILDHNGYLRLYYRDMEEVVEGLKMPEDVTLFGPQVTVETALFRDVFELVPDEES